MTKIILSNTLNLLHGNTKICVSDKTRIVLFGKTGIINYWGGEAMNGKKKQEEKYININIFKRIHMEGIPNRSEFIRSAILVALKNTCPLCRGTGILTPEQQKHWQIFAQSHTVKKCDDCHSFHLVCTAEVK